MDLRKLDALIAEKVMGYPAFAEQVISILKEHIDRPCLVCGRDDGSTECLPHYSTSIEAAWEVFEWLTKLNDHSFSIGYFHGIDDGRGPLKSAWLVEDHTDWDEYKTLGMGDTAPLAICLAALKAMEK